MQAIRQKSRAAIDEENPKQLIKSIMKFNLDKRKNISKLQSRMSERSTSSEMDELIPEGH